MLNTEVSTAIVENTTLPDSIEKPSNLSINVESSQNNVRTETELFTDEELEKYIEGCADLGLELHTAVEKAIESGHRPTILIPARGAVPLYILGLRHIKKLGDSENDILNSPNKVRYFPQNTFSHISGGSVSESQGDTSIVDVIMYPFTADVVAEREQQSSENIAEKIRRSAVFGFLDIFGNSPVPEHHLYRLWHDFLQNKLKGQKNQITEHYAVELQKYPLEKRHIILVDTVISGRASSHILSAFQERQVPVTAVLAVDKRNGETVAKYDQPNYLKYKNRIESQSLITKKYIRFPVLSEDEGPLLGVNAVNFLNFYSPEMLSQLHPEKTEFFPQSCVWMPPLESAGSVDLELFQAFLDRCSLDEQTVDWKEKQKNLVNLLKQKHTTIQPRSVEQILEQGARIDSVRSTSSGILSIQLENQTASNWIKEFVGTIEKK